jgi:hypothetical protein
MLFLFIPGENVVQTQESSRFSYSGVGESKGGAGPAAEQNCDICAYSDRRI